MGGRPRSSCLAAVVDELRGLAIRPLCPGDLSLSSERSHARPCKRLRREKERIKSVPTYHRERASDSKDQKSEVGVVKKQ